jgi:hypothetical protein
VAITGSAPPIKFGFPPCSKSGPLAHPLPRDIAQPLSLKDAEAAFATRRPEEANEETNPGPTEWTIPISAAGDEIYPAFDLDADSGAARRNLDSIIDSLLNSLPSPETKTAASQALPTPDHIAPFDANYDVNSAHFLLLTPDNLRRWKGAPLSLDEAKDLPPVPQYRQMSLLGMTEQQPIELGKRRS